VRRLEKWKTKDRFSTFPPGARDDNDDCLSEPKNQRKEVGRYAASSFFKAALPPAEGNRFHAHLSIGKCSAQRQVAAAAFGSDSSKEKPSPFRA
jgi:hypothetical protein